MKNLLKVFQSIGSNKLKSMLKMESKSFLSVSIQSFAGNKVDMFSADKSEKVTKNMIGQFQQRHKIRVFSCSAKTGSNIKESFNYFNNVFNTFLD